MREGLETSITKDQHLVILLTDETETPAIEDSTKKNSLIATIKTVKIGEIGMTEDTMIEGLRMTLGKTTEEIEITISRINRSLETTEEMTSEMIEAQEDLIETTGTIEIIETTGTTGIIEITETTGTTGIIETIEITGITEILETTETLKIIEIIETLKIQEITETLEISEIIERQENLKILERSKIIETTGIIEIGEITIGGIIVMIVEQEIIDLEMISGIEMITEIIRISEEMMIIGTLEEKGILIIEMQEIDRIQEKIKTLEIDSKMITGIIKIEAMKELVIRIEKSLKIVVHDQTEDLRGIKVFQEITLLQEHKILIERILLKEI